MTRNQSHHWGSHGRVFHASLPKETDRWVALLAEPANRVLQEAPFRYGPITISGLFEASSGKKTRKNFMAKMQTLSSLELALLFVRCGAVRAEMPALFLRYSTEVMAASELSGTLLRGYRIALEISGGRPTAKDLLAVSPLFPFGSASYGDTSEILQESEFFATTPEDATEIVRKWGEDKTRHSGGGSGRITCMSMVAHFPRADSDVMAALCLAEDDFEALAFMVKQGRWTTDLWLNAVADCVGTQSSRYVSSNNPNPTVEKINRSSEQARAWRLLQAAQGQPDLREACLSYASANPARVRDILQQAPDPIVQFDSWVLWTLGWVSNGLASADNPIVVEQVINAEKALDLYMSKPDELFENNTKLPWIHNLSELTLDWFLEKAPLLAETNGALRDLLATRLLLRWTDGTDKLRGMGQPRKPEVQHALDKMPWLNGANVELALRLRLQYQPADDAAGAVPLPLLLQYRVRAPALWPAALAQLAVACNRGESGVREILDAWLSSGPGPSYSPVPAKLTKGEKLVYSMTGLDPTPAMDLAKSLSVDNTSNEYQTMLAGWLEQSLACGVPSVSVELPDMHIAGAGPLLG